MVIKVTKEIRTKRLDTCKKCPELALFLGGICKKCGCAMLVKTWIESAECPSNKWGAISIAKDK